MKTKYFFMLLVACFLGAQSLSAQNKEAGNRPRKRMSIEQLTERQANKLAEEMGLDDKTSARFKDVFRNYKMEMNDLWKKNMPKKPQAKSDGNKKSPQLTDDEVDKMMRDKFKLSRKMLDVREKYYNEFRKFLNPKQVQKVYSQGEMDRGKFHREMNRRAGMKKPGEGGRQPMEASKRNR